MSDGKPLTLDYGTGAQRHAAEDPGFREALIVVSVAVGSLFSIVLLAAWMFGHPWRALLSGA